MPEWTSELMPLVDHWRSFQNPQTAAIFDFDSHEMAEISKYSKDPATGRYASLSSYVTTILHSTLLAKVLERIITIT